jgi:hypothetical protein
MPLQFPSSASIGQTYQSGSLATYVYNGEAWDVQSFGVVSVTSASFATTSTSASFATTASYLNGEVPTVIFARNTSAQTIGSNVIPTTVLTNWTNVIRQNGAEWDQATGLFTATKAGTYQISAAMAYAAITGTVGQQYNIAIVKNGIDQSIVINFIQDATSMIRPTGTVTSIVTVVPGEIISINVYHITGANRTMLGSAAANYISIQEIPTRIQR